MIIPCPDLALERSSCSNTEVPAPTQSPSTSGAWNCQSWNRTMPATAGTWQRGPRAQENKKAGHPATSGHGREHASFSLARGPHGSSAQAQTDPKHLFAWRP